MGLRRWLRDMRLSMALLGPLGGLRSVPIVPEQTVREPWPGDAASGELIVQGSASWRGVTRVLTYARWTGPDWPAPFRDWFQSFEWLRDLRELGTDSARAKARSMVATWIGQPMSDTQLENPAVTGARIAAWLSHYDFFAASADDTYRQNLLNRITLEARTIIALLPSDRHDWTSLQALKGLLAAAVAMPRQSSFLAKFMKLIDAELECQILPDGCHACRSPEAQFLALRELAEMRLLLQTAQIPMPTTLAAALDRMAPVLRAFRHGDGRLALFNSTAFHAPELIDLVIMRAMPRGHVLARSMPDGRFVRAASGNTILLADGGTPPPPASDRLAHAGMMSFEMSSGRSQIIVNCGTSIQPAWQKALRDAPAHSVLSLPACPPLIWGDDGHLRTRPPVKSRHEVEGTDHLIELSSDCYRPAGTGTCHRRLWLGKEGTDLRGEDRLDAVGGAPEFVLRFHLHPSVRVELEETDILLHTQDEVWSFRSNGYAFVEESVYCGGPEPRGTLQIVVRPAEIYPDPEEVGEAEPSAQPDATETSVTEAEHSEQTEESDSETGPEDASEATPPSEGEETAKDEADLPMPDAPEEPETPSRIGIPSNSIRWALTRLDS